MSSTNTAATRTKKPKKDPKRTGSGGGTHARVKSVVRRLPPNLPEDVFWGSVAPWAARERVAWRVFCPGRPRRVGKEGVPSRAYIAFRSEEELVAFARGFDGHLFRDKTGNEFQAVVEYAPYQKVPSEKKKVDARSNTIEKDEDYLSFIASLKASETAEAPSLETLLAAAQAQAQPAPKTTPLLEALKAEKSAHKDKEAILRSHAHYKDKDPTILAAPPRGGAEPKKKGGKAVAAPVAEASGSGSGKKGKKAAQGQQQAAKAAPRPPKPAKGPKQPAAAVAPAAVPAVTVATPGPPPAAPRRTRPVVGLGSRQFEAALSGVAGGGRAKRGGGAGRGGT